MNRVHADVEHAQGLLEGLVRLLELKFVFVEDVAQGVVAERMSRVEFDASFGQLAGFLRLVRIPLPIIDDLFRGRLAVRCLCGDEHVVALARAIAKRPNLLLCDEPTGNLDEQNSREILELFRRLNDDGHTIVMVTHDRDVAAFANRIMILRNGTLSEA